MQIEMTPHGLLRTFFRHLKLFLAMLAVILLAGVSFIVFSKPLYESEASLLVKFGQDASPAPAKLGEERMLNDRREIMESHIEMLQSRELIRALVQEFGPETLYPGITKHLKAKDSGVEEATRRIQEDDLSVHSSQLSNIIEIRLLNQDPQLSADFIRRLIENFIRKQVELYHNPQIDFLREQVKHAETQLQQSQLELRDFKASAGISSIEEELSQLLKDKGEATTIAFQAVDDAESNLLALKAKEVQLLATYRTDSLPEQQLKKAIREAQKQLRDRQADLRTVSGKPKGVLGAQLAIIDKRIKLLEKQRNHYNDLARAVQIDEQNYKNYAAKSEEARLSELLNEKNITHISILDEPVAEMRPVRPRKGLVFALSLIAGILAALGMVAWAEGVSEYYSTPRQLENSLELPVIAHFSAGAK